VTVIEVPLIGTLVGVHLALFAAFVFLAFVP
jgi:hypothetical protein